MSSRRPVVLMAILLVLVFGYLLKPDFGQPSLYPEVVPAAPEPPLPGENSISNLVVRKNDTGQWEASFDYYYTGEPRMVGISVDTPEGGSAPAKYRYSSTTFVPGVARGSHSVTAKLSYPGDAGITRQVLVRMYDSSKTGSDASYFVARAQVDQLIEWPSWFVMEEEQQFAELSPQQNLQRAIKLIDSGQRDNFERAKGILERLVSKDPSLTQAYIELARIAMKTNWGPEGLHHAESLLSSARQIEPENANARILMGYVYTHQKRYKAAEALFTEAAASNPPNLWLWTNWGELPAMQGRLDQAAAKYRQAITRPRTEDTYDYARADSYRRLIALLERNKDLDGIEALYKATVTDFGEVTCFSVSYAKFLVQHRGDAASASTVARSAFGSSCSPDDARQVFGLAQYVLWARGEGASRAEALNQARIYLPPGAQPFYLLARSEKTVDVAAKLAAAGEKIDQRDNDKLTALAHAVRSEDLQTARRLLRLGAKPDALVGYDDVPVAIMPVMSGNLEMVKLMQQFGADYAKITYLGATAFDFAQQTGDVELKNLLSHKPQTL